MLITWKLCSGLPSIRRRAEADVFFSALRRVNREHRIRIVHWVILSNHIHAIVEGEDGEAIGQAMKGLTVSLSRRWNRLWNRSGQVFADRYHRTDLDRPTKVRNALTYVFANNAKHTGGRPCIHRAQSSGRTKLAPYVDARYSSALYFTAWQEPYIERLPPDDRSPRPRSWLLRTGFLRSGGAISASAKPALA
ncbi:MAG: transposase [Planctomycetota bacterium]